MIQEAEYSKRMQVMEQLRDETIEARYERYLNSNMIAGIYGDREWAFEVLGQSLTRLREEYAVAGKARLFVCLRGFLPTGETPFSYAEAARILDMDEPAVRLAIHELRRRFAELLRDGRSP